MVTGEESGGRIRLIPERTGGDRVNAQLLRIVVQAEMGHGQTGEILARKLADKEVLRLGRGGDPPGQSGRRLAESRPGCRSRLVPVPHPRENEKILKIDHAVPDDSQSRHGAAGRSDIAGGCVHRLPVTGEQGEIAQVDIHVAVKIAEQSDGGGSLNPCALARDRDLTVVRLAQLHGVEIQVARAVGGEDLEAHGQEGAAAAGAGGDADAGHAHIDQTGVVVGDQQRGIARSPLL